jgi:pimeloyl-ACP methyl ester carboxylesterase
MPTILRTSFEQVGLSKVIAVGHSMGGVIVLQLAAAHPGMPIVTINSLRLIIFLLQIRDFLLPKG